MLIFLPYRLYGVLFRIPFLTLAVCVVCVLNFLQQLASHDRFEKSASAFCAGGLTPNQRSILEHFHDERGFDGCEYVFQTIRQSAYPDRTLAGIAAKVTDLQFYPDPKADLAYKIETLESAYGQFQMSVPPDLTGRRAYVPDQYSLPRMITASFAHVSWEHLIGNLIFFYAFACGVECLLGPVHFVLCFLLMAVGTALAYSFSIGTGDPLPTVGLSGVCMGMLALLGVLLPRAQIWFFFWVIIWFRTFTVPALLLAAFYAAWDFIDWTGGDMSVNHAGHLGGAATGLLLGVAYRLFAAKRLARATTALKV